MKKRIAAISMAMVISLSSSTFAFSDTSNSWAKEHIEKLANMKVVSGYPDGTFRPGNSISREEAVAIIQNYFDKFINGNNQASGVSDIQGRWSTKVIEKAIRNGLISGYPDGTFRPENTISRAEFSTLVYRALQVFSYDGPIQDRYLSDVYGHWGMESIIPLLKFNLINGYPDGTFKPDNDITREEASKILNGLGILSKKSGSSSVDLSENNSEYFYNIDFPDEDIRDYVLRRIHEATDSMDSSITLRLPGIVSGELFNYSTEEFYRDNYIGRITRMSSYEMSFSSLPNMVTNITYNLNYNHTKQQEEEIVKYVRESVKSIKSKYSSDYDIIKAAHDEVIRKTSYSKNLDSGVNSVGVSIYTPYSIISDGTGVCNSYSLLFYKFIEELGYDVKLVYGVAKGYGDHAWNMVKIGSSWYHVDTTWDDPADILRYDYFLVSDDQISKTHTWDRDKIPKAPISGNKELTSHAVKMDL